MMSIDELYTTAKKQWEITELYNNNLVTLKETCTVKSTDDVKTIRKKCKNALKHGEHYYPMRTIYAVSGTATDTSVAGGMSEEVVEEAQSSTERGRKFRKNNPGKVKRYLRKTVKDRAARNRDRAKAVKKHGKAKMKNHDVHHPNGPNGGSWRLAKKDHGPDKKSTNESMLVEGGAAGHLAHPFEDTDLSFKDMKTMIDRGLVGGLDTEAPVTEKLDGQNIAFTIRDGKVVFARNKGHVKNKGKNALDSAGIKQMFAGRGNIEKAFSSAATDLDSALDKLSPEQKQEIFKDGSRFMNVEVMFPDSQNVIPYGKSVLVFHGGIEYDEEGNEIDRSTSDGKLLSDKLTQVGADKQKTFGISGPRVIAFSNEDSEKSAAKSKQYAEKIDELIKNFKLKDSSTLGDYRRAWWNKEFDAIAERDGIRFTPEEKKGLISRWADGSKDFGVKHLSDPWKKEWFRHFESKSLPKVQKMLQRPLESIFLQAGADSLLRVSNFLAANNPGASEQLKKDTLDAISALRKSTDPDKMEKLRLELDRLEGIGMDKIVPSEGIVFMYNGKPYKFTGTFAPINQLQGTFKFGPPDAPAKETEDPNAPKKLYLDDLRPTPKDFNLRAYTAQEAIAMLEKGGISAISFDHDLGPDEAGTGYDVAKWIEEKAYTDPNFTVPEWNIHSANPVGAKNIERAMESSERASARLKENPPEPEQPEEVPQEASPDPVAIFSGRFQPFHAGHYSIYQSLVDKFGKDNVYIATSDKTDPIKSPFSFVDRKEIMTNMFDIPADKVAQIKNPYNPEEILSKFPDNTPYVTAVSEKDAERLGNRKKYFTSLDNTDVSDLKGYKEQGYFMVAPEMQMSVNGKNVSGTQLRAVMGDPNITDRAKQEIFTKAYGAYNPKIFSKIVKVATASQDALKITNKYANNKTDPIIPAPKTTKSAPRQPRPAMMTAPKLAHPGSDKQKPTSPTPDKPKPAMMTPASTTAAKGKNSTQMTPGQRLRLKAVLSRKIANKNPDMNIRKRFPEILVATALKHDKNDPTRKAAERLVASELAAFKRQQGVAR